MEIEKGDIFVLSNDAYLLVFDVIEGFEDDYGVFPDTVRVIPALRGLFHTESEWENSGLAFRDWGVQALDPVLLDIFHNNLINRDALERLERVGYDTEVQPALRKAVEGNVNEEVEDEYLRDLRRCTFAALCSMPNPMTGGSVP
jgi:hypothetical protein